MKIKLSDIWANTDLIKMEKVKIAEYIPIAHKRMIIEGFIENDGSKHPGIVDMCLKQDIDGMYYIDYFVKEVALVTSLVQAYCLNIEFDEIEIEDTMYDFYITSGIWDEVKENIPEDEYWIFMDLLDNTLAEKVESKNSIEGILCRGLDKFVEVVDKNMNPKEINKLIGTFSKEFKEFNFDKLGVVGDVVSHLTNPPKKSSKKKK